MNDDIIKSVIVLIQNGHGDKEILLRIVNDLRNDKKPFGPDLKYLKELFERHLPDEKKLLEDI